MSLRVLQKLLVISALAWALLPTWGGALYAASVVVLAVGTVRRVRAARVILDAHREALSRGLSADTLDWVRRFPLVYVWKDSARQWGTTWRMSGLLALLLAPWFAIRALAFQETWELALLIPLAAMLLVGVRVALRLEVGELLTDAKWRAFGPRHEDALRYLGMRVAAGLWPPEPSPDEGPAAPPPPSGPPVSPSGGLSPPRAEPPKAPDA